MQTTWLATGRAKPRGDRRDTDPDLIDELLAPDYVNVAMGDADLAAFKAMVPP